MLKKFYLIIMVVLLMSGTAFASESEEIIRLAKQGDAEAAYKLGEMYHYGYGVKQQNKQEAVKWYRVAAEQGHEWAAYTLGYMLYYGEGVTKDIQEGIKWLRQASAQGNSNAKNILNKLKLEDFDFKDTATDSQEAKDARGISVEQLDAEAQYQYGRIYERGEGVVKDVKEAVKWYRMAAERGHVNAQFNLGVIFSEGYGIEKDEQEAFKWMLMAAEQNDSEAQNNVGLMYLKGLGTEKDAKEAARYFKMAALKGTALAQLNLGNLYYNGVGVKQNYKEAFKWYRKAAEQGYADAQFKLGHMYYNGIGADKNIEDGEKWLDRSARQGNIDARNFITQIEAERKSEKARLRTQEGQELIDIVRSSMYYSNYPADLDYLTFGRQLEKFFQKGEWSVEHDEQLENSFGSLAVFKGIGKYDEFLGISKYAGRRAWITVKIGRAKKDISNIIRKDSLAVVSIYENNNRVYYYAFDRSIYSSMQAQLELDFAMDLARMFGQQAVNAKENDISFSDFLKTIYN